jgi:hypothetical protein
MRLCVYVCACPDLGPGRGEYAGWVLFTRVSLSPSARFGLVYLMGVASW